MCSTRKEKMRATIIRSNRDRLEIGLQVIPAPVYEDMLAECIKHAGYDSYRPVVNEMALLAGIVPEDRIKWGAFQPTVEEKAEILFAVEKISGLR